MKICVLAGAALAALASVANADVLANWTFETSIPANAGPFSAEAGIFAATSQASGSHAGASTYSSPAGNGSAHSFSSTGWAVGDYYQFTTTTTGYTGISIGWDQTSSNTGPAHFVLQWSTDGVNYTTLGAQYTVLANGTPNPAWSTGTNQPAYTFAPVGGPAGLDNQATIYFRFRMNDTVSANGGTVASGGTDRLDNVIISGTRVPAPGSLALLGVAGLVARRRR